MRAKLILLLFVFSLLTGHVVQSQKKITITLDAQKTPQPGWLAYSYLKKQPQTFEFDGNNRSECVVQGADYIYLTIHNGLKEELPVYAEYGDEVRVSFDGENLKDTRVIKGGHDAIQKYLENFKVNPVSFPIFKMEFPQFMQEIDKLTAANLQQFEAYTAEINKSSRIFVSLERNRIRCASNILVLNYPRYYAQANQIVDFQPGQEFYDILASYVKEDASLLYLHEYQSMILESVLLIAQRTRKITTQEDRISALVEYFSANFKDVKVREYFIHKLISEYVSNNGVRTTQKFDDFYRKNISNKELMKEYKEIYNNWQRVSPGQRMPDFSATDITGKQYSLKNFKGKYLCLYVWPNVYPCREEYKKFQNFKTLFQERNINLVCLSMEENADNWKTAIKDMPMGQHLLLQDLNNFTKICHYQSYQMHQLILVDPEGKIVEINGPTPSSNGFEEFIKLYTKI